jgi:hypothetical protein
MLQTVTSVINAEQNVDRLTSPKRKRVAFDPSGTLLFILPRSLTIAVSMAEKHEKKPTKASTTKKTKFRKTADFGLNSASAWNDFNINLLGAEYDKDEYHNLPLDVTEFGRNEALNTFGEGTHFDRLH